MFGDVDGGPFLTDSIRSGGKGESPKVKSGGSGSLFSDREEEAPEGDIFSSTSSR